jgi:hypothetical protein
VAVSEEEQAASLRMSSDDDDDDDDATEAVSRQAAQREARSEGEPGLGTSLTMAIGP